MKENGLPWDEDLTDGHRVRELYVLVVIDEEGNEGVPGIGSELSPVVVPAISSSPASLRKFVHMCEELKEKGAKVKVLRFRNPEEVQT